MERVNIIFFHMMSKVIENGHQININVSVLRTLKVQVSWLGR